MVGFREQAVVQLVVGFSGYTVNGMLCLIRLLVSLAVAFL